MIIANRVHFAVNWTANSCASKKHSAAIDILFSILENVVHFWSRNGFIIVVDATGGLVSKEANRNDDEIIERCAVWIGLIIDPIFFFLFYFILFFGFLLQIFSKVGRVLKIVTFTKNSKRHFWINFMYKAAKRNSEHTNERTGQGYCHHWQLWHHCSLIFELNRIPDGLRLSILISPAGRMDKKEREGIVYASACSLELQRYVRTARSPFQWPNSFESAKTLSE